MAAAIVMSTVGTGVFLALRRALGTLIDSPWLLAGCVAGAIVSTLLFYDGRGLGFRNNLRPAVRIVFSTFAVIASGHAVSQRYQRGVKIDFEPIGVFLWAVLATSWWLVPGAALTLSVFNRLLARREAHESRTAV